MKNENSFDLEHRTERRIQLLELQVTNLENLLRHKEISKPVCKELLSQIMTEVKELRQDLK